MNFKSSVFFNLICILSLLIFMQKMAYSSIPTPPLQIGHESAENMVVWSNKALSSVSEDPSLAESTLEHLSRFIQYLESLSVAEIEKNKAHFDHLQKLKNCEFKVLYWFGIHNLELKAWNAHQIEQHLDQLRARNATSEFELAFLKALKWWPDFYKKQREVLELYEAFPQKLSLKPPIPPEIYELQGLPINSLHDLTVIIDIALKYYWKPNPDDFEILLLSLADEFQNKKAYNYAYEALELVDSKKRSSKMNQKISELKNKAKSVPTSKSIKSLY
jgi:hypothetical protein